MKDYHIQFTDYYNVVLTEHGKAYLDDLAEEFGEKEIREAIDIAGIQYGDVITALQKLRCILYNRRKLRREYIKEMVE